MAERFMAVPRIAALVGGAILAALASLPVQAGGAGFVVRIGDSHGHRPNIGQRQSLHQHADNHHRAHYGHLHHPPKVIFTHPPRHRVIVIPRAPVVHYTAPAPVYAPAPAAGPFVLNAPAFAVDGDTFDAGGVRYRLAGIDAPELHEPNGYNARARLQQLLSLGQVTLIPLGTDVYGRVLVEVLVGAWNVSGVLRSEGYAK